jgi:hypothetical protein
MDYKFFLREISKIILDPVKAWETIESENKPLSLLRDSYLLALVILVSVSAFFGSLFFSNSELSYVYSLFESIKCFALFYATIYAAAYIFGEITYPLDLGKSFTKSFRIIVYSITPFLICQILSRLFESIQFLDILGLYGLYIFWTGSEKLLAPPQYKKMPMLIASVVLLVAVYVITNALLNMVMDRIFYAFFD